MSLGIGIGISPFLPPSGGGWPAVEAMGTLIDVDFTTAINLDDFTQVKPNSTIALSGGFLNVVQSPGTGTFSNYMVFDTYGSTILEKWSMETIIIPRTITATSYGVSLGLFQTQTNTPVNPFNGFIQMNSDGRKGQVSIYNQPNNVINDGGVLAFSADDRIKLTFTRNKNILTFTCENLTTPSIASATYTVSMAYGSSFFPPVIGKPAIWFSGGTHDIEKFTYTSDAIKNANVTFFGDSITAEYGVATILDRYADTIMTGSIKDYNVCGSVAAMTADLALCLNEITLLNSRYNVICIGVNDQYQSVPIITSKENLENIIAVINNNIILNYLIPFETNNPVNWNAMIDSLSITPIVDLTTILGTGSPKYPEPTLYNLDLLHPNQAGADVIASEYLLNYPDLA